LTDLQQFMIGNGLSAVNILFLSIFINLLDQRPADEIQILLHHSVLRQLIHTVGD